MTKMVQITLEDQPISEATKVERAKEANQLMDEIEQVEADFKRERAQWREKLELLKEKRRKATQAFREGVETRVLMCEERIDWTKRTAAYWHEGKIIRERPLDPMEQQPLFEGEQTPTTDEQEQPPPQVRKLNKNGAPIVKQASSSEVVAVKAVMKEEKSRFKKDHTA